MKTPGFDGIIDECRQTTVPALPSSFSANVLREIRQRSAEDKTESGWFSLLFGYLRPGIVAGSLCLALAVGVLAPGLVREDTNAMAADGLGLNVFSTSKMPSDLIK